MTQYITRILDSQNMLFIFVLFCCVTSFGIILVTVGGSWDITNHLLNKPETFFSPPHTFMYTGVAIALIGVIFSFLSWRKLDNRSNYKLSIRVMGIGIFLLVGAGPFDFVWHENFGLDGLLSPSHMTLVIGMLMCAFGAFIAVSKFVMNNNRTKLYLLAPLSVLPVWLAGYGMISSLSLPFSNTEFFKFNPDPHLAVIIASLAFPFLISFSLSAVARISYFRFGLISITGLIFLMVNGFTGVVINQSIHDTASFYFLNFVPIVLADFVVSFYKGNKAMLFAGGLFGSVFSLIYYPYIVYTFNEVLRGTLVSPSMISSVYFELLSQIFSYTIISGIILGIFGVYASSKMIKNIVETKETSLQ